MSDVKTELSALRNESTGTATEGSVKSELELLKEQNAKLKNILENKNFNPANQILGSIVQSVLGNRFEWRILGLGQFQTLEIELPEDLAHPSTSYEANKFYEKDYERNIDGTFKRNIKGDLIETGQTEKDGRLSFYKTHPKAGKKCGDVRHCRIKDETQIRQWLEMVKKEILDRFKAESKSITF